jgi:hypothetical protein
MDNQFWKTIQENDCTIPEGHSLKSLTPEIFSLLGSTDPELRDDLAYAILVEWVERDLYSPDELRQAIEELCANLEVGIGETETDSVFLRAFSILTLALIVYYDNHKSFLSPEEVRAILDQGLQYLTAEKDPRGYVPVKGWAHALAHTADLYLVLAENKNTGAAEHNLILSEIAQKLVNATNWVYVHGEDDRLSAAVLAIFQRGLLALPTIKEWLNSLINPKPGTWKGAWTQEESTRAFFNVRNFLRSLYLQITTENEFPQQEELEQMLLETIQNLKPY